MADLLLHDTSPPPPSPPSPSPSFIKRLLGKRRTWVLLFVIVYALLLSSSWNILRSILSWYSTTTTATSAIGWPALYASVLFGAVFGLLSMTTALAIAVPATVVTWITVLVLLAFAGRKRQSLVADGRNITADIARSTMKIVLKEGNLVAAACAILSYLALTRSREDD